jgi:uncharacterized protein involved in exopolysaccharide biosynthesis
LQLHFAVEGFVCSLTFHLDQLLVYNHHTFAILSMRKSYTSRIRELESRSEILSQAEEQLNQQVKQLSIVSRQYTDIQQEIKITNDNLNQFLTKR